MSKVYAVTVDTFCNGESIRGLYTIVKAPFSEEAEAISQIDDVIEEMESKYRSLETKGNSISVRQLDEKTKVIVKETNGNVEPMLRCTVLGVDMSVITSVQKKTFNQTGSSKKASEEQKQYNKMFKKISQYVATLTPEAISCNL